MSDFHLHPTTLMVSIWFSWDMKTKTMKTCWFTGGLWHLLFDSGSMGPSKQLRSLMQVAFVWRWAFREGNIFWGQYGKMYGKPWPWEKWMGILPLLLDLHKIQEQILQKSWAWWCSVFIFCRPLMSGGWKFIRPKTWDTFNCQERSFAGAEYVAHLRICRRKGRLILTTIVATWDAATLDSQVNLSWFDGGSRKMRFTHLKVAGDLINLLVCFC